MTPKETLVKFLEAWKAKNYNKMFKFSQVTYKSNHSKNEIEKIFSELKLESFEISNTIQSGIAAIKAPVKLKVNGKEFFVNAMIIRETAPYRPSAESGIWGVNPISILGNG